MNHIYSSLFTSSVLPSSAKLLYHFKKLFSGIQILLPIFNAKNGHSDEQTNSYVFDLLSLSILLISSTCSAPCRVIITLATVLLRAIVIQGG